MTPPKLNTYRTISIGALTVLILLTVFGGWAGNALIAGAILGTGRLETIQNRVVVQHLVGGQIDRVHVRDGDLVEAGEALISLDTTDLNAELSILRSQHHEIAARYARAIAIRDASDQISFPDWLVREAVSNQVVRETLDAQRNLHEATRNARRLELDQLRHRKDQNRAQLHGIETQITALEHQQTLLNTEIDQQNQLLEDGLVPLHRLFALRREAAAVEVKIAELTNLKIELDGRQTDIHLKILSLEADNFREAAVQLRDLHVAHTEISHRIQTIETQRETMTVRAPIAGRLHDLVEVSESSVLRAIDPIAVIIPQDRDLRVSVHIKPSDIDEVSVGQTAFVRLVALAAKMFEDLGGMVTHVSADTLVDPATGISYYLAQVALRPFDPAEVTEDILRPGMEAGVFFRTGDRTPLSYLVEPLTRYFGRAMRES